MGDKTQLMTIAISAESD
ncbi:MAG: TMEM165/GDT1 family protein [Clostridium sp.]|nr:hypothetical protein [Clostridium sp.]MCE5222116.1 TMEM165/GDT1 family protein [Clostridium sp.]